MFEFVKMPKEQVVCLTNRVMSYLAKGRLPDIEGTGIADSDLGSTSSLSAVPLWEGLFKNGEP